MKIEITMPGALQELYDRRRSYRNAETERVEIERHYLQQIRQRTEAAGTETGDVLG